MVQYNTESDQLILVNLPFLFYTFFFFKKLYIKWNTNTSSKYITHNKQIKTIKQLLLHEKYLKTIFSDLLF